MKRILVIPSWYPPQGGEFFRSYSELLQALGYEVHVLVNLQVGIRQLRWKYFMPQPMVQSQENGLLVYRHYFRRIPKSDKLNLQRWNRKLIHLFEQYKQTHGLPDLIHAHSAMWAGYGAGFIARHYKRPLLLTEHRSRLVANNPNARRAIARFHRPYLRRAFRQATRIVTVSQSMQAGIQQVAQTRQLPMQTIYNPINTDYFRCSRDINEKPQAFTFLTAGLLEAVKGMDTLIAAFAIVEKKTDIPVYLRIAGSGKKRKGLQALVVQKGLSDHVHFTGHLPPNELRDEMCHSHCFVLASRYEAFGMVLAEAMACGTPLIATRSGGPEEIITPATGQLVAIDDVQALAHAMLQLVKGQWHVNPERIRETAVRRFGQQQIGQQYQQVIDELITR